MVTICYINDLIFLLDYREVMKAWDKDTNEEVAIKKVRLARSISDDDLARAEREMVIMEKIDEENVLSLIDAYRIEGKLSSDSL